jgi:hypothetical protein
MGAVVDRCDLGTNAITELEMVKQHLRIVHNAEDAVLGLMIVAAKERADEYLNNPFLDSTGAEIAIPSAVKMWLLSVISDMYQNRVNRLKTESVSNVGSQEFNSEINFELIAPYRLNPGL